MSDLPVSPLLLAAIGDAELRVQVLDSMPDHGFRVLTAGSTKEIPGLVRQHAPEILLIDKAMAAAAGPMILDIHRVRVALCDPRDRKTMLHLLRDVGAAACVNLPLQSELLAAALDSLLRLLRPKELGDGSSSRARGGEEPGAWTLSRTTWTLMPPSGAAIRLTQAETTFLVTLAESPGDPVPRRLVIGALGHNVDYYDSRRLDTLVSRLRLKVARDGEHSLPVRSIHSVGYAVVVPITLED